MKIISIVVMVILLFAILPGTALAEPLKLLCEVNIGDPGSEAGHNVISWGPIEPDTHPVDGSWGGFVATGENARVIWGHEEATKEAFVTLDRHISSGAAKRIVIRHLDGIYFDDTWEDASFDVLVKDRTGNWVRVFHYSDLPLWSTWVTSTIELDNDIDGNPLDLDENANVEVQLYATGEMWLHHPSDFGQVAFDWFQLWGEDACPPPVECDRCKGGITSLTLQYNGAASAHVIVKAKRKVLFNATVVPGEMFTVIGKGKHGKLGSEIGILVNGRRHTNIHTSCSKPIGIGMVFGDFKIVGGESLKGGTLCPVPDVPACGRCKGGITSLTLQYNGAASAHVIVKAKKKVLYNATVVPGGMFTVIGTGKYGKLGSQITILVDGKRWYKRHTKIHANIHTSCSRPIGIGMVFGDFKIVGGESLKGGTLCPVIK